MLTSHSDNSSIGTTLQADLEEMKEDLANFFYVVMGCLVFLMQPGFALLEAGSVR